MIYEFEFGVFIDAEDEQDAWQQVRHISAQLDDVDIEGDSSVGGPYEVPPVITSSLTRAPSAQ